MRGILYVARVTGLFSCQLGMMEIYGNVTHIDPIVTGLGVSEVKLQVLRKYITI